MQLENYFEFLTSGEIWVKGTRIGIEHILYEYIHCDQTPEAIAQQFRTVTLEQVYATILYYLHERETIGKYVQDWLDYTRQAQADFDRSPPPFVAKVLQWKEQQQAAKQVEPSQK